RGGGIAMAQPTASPAARRARTLLRSLRAFTLHPPHLRPQVVQLLLDAVGGGVELQRLLPGGGGILVVAVLEVRVTEVLEDDRVFLGSVDRPLELAQRVGEAPLLIEGRADTVEEAAVVRLRGRRVGGG